MFSDCYLDLTGGIVTVMKAQKKALEKLGHTVYIFTTGYPKTKTELEKLAKKNVFVVPSCRFLIRRVTPVSRRPRIIEKWILKKHPEIREFDVFYTHYEAGCSIAGIRLGHELKIPVVQIMHGREDMGETNIMPPGLRTIVAWGLNGMHGWYLPHTKKVQKDDYLANTRAKARMWTLVVNHADAADFVITPAEHYLKKLKHYGVTKGSRVVRNAVADELFPSSAKIREWKDGEPLRMIWHSRVSGEKRIMVLLEALTRVKGEYELDVYGGGPELVKAKLFAQTHRLKNVKFHGDTEFEELKKKLSKAHLDVLVSYNYDVCPMTLLEAQAVGTPVFICDKDMASLVPRGGYVLADGPTAEEIAEALNKLFTQREQIRKMSEVMAKHREEALESYRINELVKIFNDIIKA
ncbi:glycosyltransferase [Candidatus Saccharibacteria bacterium]|nr:glycosyltransferase [Candidatus Saccharibacteria bacterium]